MLARHTARLGADSNVTSRGPPDQDGIVGVEAKALGHTVGGGLKGQQHSVVTSTANRIEAAEQQILLDGNGKVHAFFMDLNSGCSEYRRKGRAACIGQGLVPRVFEAAGITERICLAGDEGLRRDRAEPGAILG